MNDRESLARTLKDWWLEVAASEIEATIPKAVEYSSVDLLELGRTMGLILSEDALSSEEATELGIYFYLLGKMARWTGAVKEGRRPSDDTLTDLSVYVKMAQRNRAVGGWPHAADE